MCCCDVPYEKNLPSMLPFAVFMFMLSLQCSASLSVCLCGPGTDALPKGRTCGSYWVGGSGTWFGYVLIGMQTPNVWSHADLSTASHEMSD